MKSPLDFLESLPKSSLDQLYQLPSSALAALQLLSNLSLQIVYRLLYSSDPVPISLIEDWTIENDNRITESLRKLEKVHIVQEDKRAISLTPQFKMSLHNALTGGGSIASFGVPSDSEDKQGIITVSSLDEYAIESWEKVLHYLVGTSGQDRPESVTKLLAKSGLMSGNQITKYVEMADSLQMNNIEMLGFLFQLGSSELGRDYSVDSLSKTQKIMLRDLAYLGLVFQRNKKSSRYYPTRLATSLTSGNSMDTFFQSDTAVKKNASEKNADSGFILVETNYKTRFANMVVGSISRDSIREALSKGISADQIISYLQSHAHPEMRKSNPILPITVVDQIRLWEMEKNRLRASRGTLYKSFGKEMYKEILTHAQKFGYVLWNSDEKLLIVVNEQGHEEIKRFFSQKKANKA